MPPQLFPVTLRNKPSRRSGIALIIVLAMLVLLSGIIIAFISSATTENTSANTAAQGYEARQAAESATNFVIAQMREATKDATGDTTWISQPGAIRTIGKNSSDNVVYKLYSSDVMQVPESSYDPGKDLAEAGLDSSGDPSTAVKGYVDMNEPVFVPAPGSSTASPTFEARYPIVSPYGKYTFSGNKFDTTKEAATAGGGAVEGFYCTDYKDTSHKDANSAPIPLLPMRVKWLYILKDGTIAGTDASGKIAGAKVGNPPVARTAFWVDDESCKLNINTATEGTYWDTPVVAAVQESGAMDGAGNPSTTPPTSLNLSMSQPVRAEYQRFPGHPATTSLSPALRWLFPPTPGDPADIEFKETIYRLAPRVQETFRNVTNGPDSSRAGTLRGRDAAKTRKPDTDRLYASVDEYFFRPDRSGRDVAETASTHSDPPGSGTSKDVAIATFTPQNLEHLRFFLTANSRTPELNIFGKPRVTIWPIHQAVNQRSAFDDLFNYCSQVGGRQFNFTRSDSNSPVDDIGLPAAAKNLEIYRYLQDVTTTKIPFIGKSFTDKLGKENRDQVLTEIFDYIRSTNLVDTEAGSHGSVAPKRTDGKGQMPSDGTYQLAFTRFFWHSTEGSGTAYGSGQVVPIRISAQLNGGSGGNKETQGFGRFVTPQEVAVLFYRVGNMGATDPVQMQAVILIDMYTLGCGYPGLAERYSTRIRIPGVDPAVGTGTPVPQIPFQVVDLSAPGGQPKNLNFPKDAVNVVDVDAYSGPIGRMFMPTRGFENQFHYFNGGAGSWNTAAKTFSKTSSFASPNPNVYPFFSDEITFPAGTKEFGLIGGSMTIDIYRRAPGTSEVKDLIQTVTLKFPDNNTNSGSPKNVLPVPGLNGTKSSDFKTRITKGMSGSRSDLNTAEGANSGYRWIENGDVIRSMEAGGSIAQADMRIIAATPEIVQPDLNYTYFEPRGNRMNPKPYENVLNPRVHGLRVSRGGYLTPKSVTDNSTDPNNPELLTGNVRLSDGSLVKGTSATRRTDRTPQLPPMMDGVTMKNGNPGDWDRGISKNMDGPFINRADEGNVNFELSAGNLGIPYYLGFSGFSEVGPTYFSPNRLMPSAVMFGGLPSRLKNDGPTSGKPEPAPWETLLFRPQAFANEHRGGSEAPADHYLLDLFHMPVVEPYAISEPLSTAGKINLNYVIAPFGYVKPSAAKDGAAYIERKTGLHGVLKVMKMLLVPKTATQHAHGPDDPTQTSAIFRYDVDRVNTMKEIQNRVDKQGLFRTASEFCEVPLYPVGAAGTPTAPATSPSAWKAFWENYALTGDNGRERPYAMIYPRLTTKSNVFTAYIRAQSIRKSPTSAVDVFDETKDKVTGEYRGSTTIERFIDPNDPAIGKYDPKTGGGLDPYYRFRIVNTKRFSP